MKVIDCIVNEKWDFVNVVKDGGVFIVVNIGSITKWGILDIVRIFKRFSFFIDNK